MSTTQHGKPTAKQRQRGRKSDQRNQKSEQQAAVRPDQDQTSDMVAAPEAEPEPIVAVAEAEPVALAASEEASEVALSGEVLCPDVRDTTPPSHAVSLQTVAQAYGDYTRKSWHANRFLVEKLVTARSLDEAIEIQGEFAKQAYANFLAQSQKVCELYGELAKQFFRPLDKFTAGQIRMGR
jgi:hypothetical protein